MSGTWAGVIVRTIVFFPHGYPAGVCCLKGVKVVCRCDTSERLDRYAFPVCLYCLYELASSSASLSHSLLIISVGVR
jgi:hypothetical protein